MDAPKIVLIIAKDMALKALLGRILRDSFSILFFESVKSSLDYIYNSMPDLLIMDISDLDDDELHHLNALKDDPIYGRLPVLVIFPDNFAISTNALTIDDFIRKACLEAAILPLAELCIKRSERMIELNPLTRLPGNIAINKEIQKRLDAGEVFALAYADLDYFKPFNDRYGFGRGDEVLKMVGRLVLNAVKGRQPHGSFVGHIGGDDFIFIASLEFVEEIAKEILSNFDSIITTFYDAEDRKNGFIYSVSREGTKMSFPVMSLSIGITHNKFRKFSHYGEMAEVASEMKKHAKYAGTSSFKVDKRRQPLIV